MLAAIFGIFLVQIAARYVFNFPIGWTVEVTLTLWLWLVFWGGGFCLRASDHIRFDMLYLSVGRKTQRIFGAVAAVLIIAAFAISFLPTVDYVWFYKIKRSNTLGIRLHYVFGVYLDLHARDHRSLWLYPPKLPDVAKKKLKAPSSAIPASTKAALNEQRVHAGTFRAGFYGGHWCAYCFVDGGICRRLFVGCGPRFITGI